MSDTYFVYVIARRDDGAFEAPVKVGISNNPRGRLSSIRTSCPYEIDIAFAVATPNRQCAREIEGAFHTVMAADRTVGEWFSIEPPKAIFYLCAALKAFLAHHCEFCDAELRETMEFSLVTGAQAIGAEDSSPYGDDEAAVRLVMSWGAH